MLVHKTKFDLKIQLFNVHQRGVYDVLYKTSIASKVRKKYLKIKCKHSKMLICTFFLVCLFLFVNLFAYLFLFICLFIFILFVYLSINLSFYLFVCLFCVFGDFCLFTCFLCFLSFLHAWKSKSLTDLTREQKHSSRNVHCRLSLGDMTRSGGTCR